MILDSSNIPANLEEMSNLMDQFYKSIFASFYERWIQMKPNIMEFNQFLDDIYGVNFKNQVA